MSTTYREDPCPLCGRPLGQRWNLHHLVPKTFKGKDTVALHVICHHKIHSVFSERELLREYHTIDRLKAHPAMESFIKWVARKKPDYHDRSRRMKR